MKKLKKNILILFMLLVAIVLGGSVEIPHERITENPKAEVRTVESKKLKENAKLNISVNKKDIEEIIGYEENGKMVFILPEEKTKMIRDEEAIVVKSLSELPNTYQGTKKNRMGTTKKFPVTKDENKGLRTVTVDKQEEAKEYYIALVDKSTGTVNKVYKSGGSVRAIIDPAPIGDTQLHWDRLLIRYHARSDNRTIDPYNPKYPITSGYEGINIWWDLYNIFFINGGFESKDVTWIRKLGYYKEFNPKITGRFTFTFSVLGDGHNTWSWNGKYGLRKGGYIYWDTTLFDFKGHTTGASDLWETRLFTIDEMKGNQEPIGGVYYGADATAFYINNENEQGWKNSRIKQVMIVVKRDPIKATIDISSNDLDANGGISLGNVKFGKELGYQELKAYAMYEITESNAGTTGITLTNQPTGHYETLKFSKDLKPGVYRIKMDWGVKEGSFTLAGTSIATGDEITINYNVVDIGEVKFRLDPRIKSDTSVNWINSKGEAGDVISRIDKFYEGLRQIEGAFSNLSSTNITDIISMEGRPSKTTNGIYNSFRTSPGAYMDEAGMKTGVNLNNLLNELIISKRNSTDPQMLDNKFTLLGADNKIYKGNIKEEYGPDKYYEGTATLDMSQHPTGTYSRWSPGVTGDAVSNSPIESTMVLSTLKLGGTKLLDSRGFGSGATITKLVIILNGAVRETTTITNNKIQGYDLDNNIGIDLVNGDVFISKNTNNTKENTYEILPYYNDVLLGKLTVKIINSNIVDLGEVTFYVDSRLSSHSGWSWINSAGDVRSGIANSPIGNYKELVQKIADYGVSGSSVIIKDVLKIEGRPTKTENGNYKVFTTGAGVSQDESTMPFNISLGTIEDKLMISKNNSGNAQMLDNHFELLGDDSRIYIGNLREAFSSDIYYRGVATLEMTAHPLNSYSVWKVGATGDAVSNSPNRSTMVTSTLKLGGTKLFDSRGVRDESSAIVTKLVVINNGKTKEVSTTVGSDVQVDFPSNSIGIYGASGDVFISKNAENSLENTYKIIPYYNDIALGELTVKVINSAIDIGEVTFKVDSRLSKHYPGGVYHYGGNLYPTELSSTGALEYPELLKTAGAFKDTGGSINKVVSVEGRPLLKRTVMDRDVFSKNDGTDESYIVSTGNMKDFVSNTVIKLKTNNSEMLDNKFVIESTDAQRYTGNIKEEYDSSIPEEGYIGTAILDLS
ncbi:MAG: hypothetical protein ACRC6K_02700, partial [Fusobacteriaceae bacterium]